MQIKILTDLKNSRDSVAEQSKDWLYQLLMFLNIDIEHLESLRPDLAMEYLLKNEIEVYDYPGLQAIRVEHKKELIGEWGSPTFTKKRDEKGELYYEVLVEHWSILDDKMDLE